MEDENRNEEKEQQMKTVRNMADPPIIILNVNGLNAPIKDIVIVGEKTRLKYILLIRNPF